MTIHWWWLIVAWAFGVLTLLAAYMMFVVLKTAWRVLKGFETSLTAATAVAENLNHNLQWMKHLSSVFTPPPQQEEEPGASEYHEPAPAARPVVQFPQPEYSKFRQEPVEETKDATKDDAVVISQTDAQMAEEERLENAREAGIDVDGPEHNPPGREVDSL